MKEEGTVRSIERAVAILECFSTSRKNLSLTYITQQTGLPLSTVLRILTTLEKQNYLRRDPNTGIYSLGWRIARLSSVAFSSMDVCAYSAPFLEKLHAEYNESVGIYIPDGEVRVCAARIDSTQSLRQCVAIGATRPIDCGASGKVLLAFSDQSLQDRLLPSSKNCTAKYLAQVRHDGYAVSFGEFITGLVSVAAPIFDIDGKILAALFLTAPSIRVDERTLQKYTENIVGYAREISNAMGYMC